MENNNSSIEQPNIKPMQNCPVVYSLSIVGRKWMLPVLCELNKKNIMRYGAIKKSIPGITNMALTQVLKDLVANDVVQRIQFEEIPPHVEYSLTQVGEKLLPALYSVAKWGLNLMDRDDVKCSCSDKCYGAYYEYIPNEREQEVRQSPERYNERYLRYYQEIIEEKVETKSIPDKLEAFLLAMLHALTEDGTEPTRWSFIFYMRNDTPNILQTDRPQYKILRDLIEEGKSDGVIQAPMETEYIIQMLSKVITGCIGAMAAVCIALFAAITLQNAESNREGAIASISIATVIPMFVLAYGCLYSLAQKETMTKMQYMESVMLIRFGSFFTAFMGYLEGIWHIIALKGGALTENPGMEAVLACGWSAIGVAATVLWVIEMRTKYVVRSKYGGIIHQTHFKRRKSI